MPKIHLGIAGWAIQAENRELFPSDGPSHLARYGAIFRAVEINSSFYNDHRAATFGRWAATVPPDFRFAVKLAKHLTHVRRLAVAPEEIEHHLSPILSLGDKLGALLVQLPPSLTFRAGVASAFFENLRRLTNAPIACEPRNTTWLGAAELFRSFRITKVWAHPEPCPDPESLFQDTGDIQYVRLHGHPRMYYSPYRASALRHLATWLKKSDRPAWVIFDNTAEYHAVPDALRLRAELTGSPGSRAPSPPDPGAGRAPHPGAA